MPARGVITESVAQRQGGGSPKLYASDRDTYVVLGWRVEGQPATIEIPGLLLRHLQPGVGLASPFVATGRRWRGDDGECDTYLVYGTPMPDDKTLAKLNVPTHEACIEVGQLQT